VTPPITTTRLLLVPMTLAFLEASLTPDRALLSTLIEATVPDEWPDSIDLVRLRIRQLRRDAALEPWLLRAIVERESRRMIGHVGFHGAPGAEHLDAYAPNAAEFGYTVFPSWRGRGYATDAARALMQWARSQRVTNFVVSIRPDNAPSLAIAQKLGFVRVGQHIDEVDGLEYVFLCSQDDETQ
jgi:RimJ/RimL family protein N-acetyltransferase